MLGNPLSARKVTQVCILCTIRLTLWIDMQDDFGDFSPISPLAFGLQKARVRQDMLFVVWRQR
ncbi:unnamed protein product [uncultured bacterium]|nr:unnamed protein product [uncultured bacterium]